ncbi:MAG: acyl-CoA dehydrogenase [Pyrinomonadaceae bacterium]|nr:acyl-CoA dehydrogenase [Pyrinomonadaceae bacterium]
MDFSWEKEQIEFRQRVVEFAEQELNENLAEREQNGLFSRELWEKCARFGIQGLANPKEFGGRNRDIDILTSILAMEGFGYGCRDNGLAFALNAQMWTVQLPIVQFGSAEQKQQFLPKLANGEWIAAHALTEAETGSDAFGLRMTAERRDGGYVLNGKKCLVSLAPIADVTLVFANANPELGKWGVTAFLIESGTAGFSQHDSQDKMGLRTVPIGELSFDNCFVPIENRLGKEGAGFSISNHSLEYERCSILASQLGTMERQLEKSIEFAQKRRQFGQAIGKFQSVANRIAEMRLRLETSRLLLYKVAWLKQAGKPAMLEAALLKLHLSESFLLSSLDTIRTHGGIGYLTKTEVERDLRDSVGGLLYAGTSDIQRNIISKLLGL